MDQRHCDDIAHQAGAGPASPAHRRRQTSRHGAARRVAAAASALLATAAFSSGVANASARKAHHTTAAATAVTVKLATVAKYGKILEDQAGLALYYNTANKPPSHWACKGQCLTYWPPLVLGKGQKAPHAGKGVSGLGVVKGPSGEQVTWKGKPLYTFASDTAGKVGGQGIGKIWYVTQVAAAKKAPATTPTTKKSSSGYGGY